MSTYNGGIDAPELGPRFLHLVFFKRLLIQGILARDSLSRAGEIAGKLAVWLDEGKLVAAETVVKGFEQLPSALAALFRGDNTGKLVVQA